MKKAILLIAALLMVGSLAFADYSIGCWGRTVFNVAGQNAGTGPISLGWGPNWGGTGLTRMGVNLSFSSKLMSFKISEYFNGAPPNAGNYDMVNMYGSCKLIPDMLTLSIGRMEGDGFDDFRKNGPNPNSDLNNNIGRMAGWGLWFVFQPKDLGLEVAVNLMTPNPNGAGSTSWQMLGGFAQQWSWETMIHNINVAASYQIPDVVKIAAAFMNGCFDNYGARTVVATTTNESNYIIYGLVDLLMIQGMTLYLDAAYYGFESTRTDTIRLDLGFGYKIGDLGLYLVGRGTVPLEGANNGVLSLNANLEVTYSIKPITVGLIVAAGVSTASGANQQFEFQPYVTLDDISLRIAFDYLMNTNGTAGNWNVPVYFTFSF